MVWVFATFGVEPSIPLVAAVRMLSSTVGVGALPLAVILGPSSGSSAGCRDQCSRLEVAVLLGDRCRRIHNPRGQRHAFPAVRVGTERLGHCAVLGEGHEPRRRIKLDGERQRAAGSADMAFDVLPFRTSTSASPVCKSIRPDALPLPPAIDQRVADRRTVNTLNRGKRRREIA